MVAPEPPDSASIAARRLALADRLLDDLERLRGQLFAPTVERQAKVVSDGARDGSHVEIVDVELDEPSFGSKRLIVAAIAQGVDKVGDLLGAEGGEDDGADWTAPPGVASIRDAKERKQGDVRAAGRGGGAAPGA